MPADYQNGPEAQAGEGAGRENGVNTERLGLKRKPKQRKPRRDPIAQSALSARAEQRGQLGAGLIQPSPIQITMGSQRADPTAKVRNGNGR